MPLRAPDLWFDLADRCGDRLVPMGTVANVWFGVKTGCDKFFFPTDASDAALKATPNVAEFEATHGVHPSEVAAGRVRIVACGEGRAERKAVEAAYLEPEVHSLMEVDGFTVAPGDCSRLILLVKAPPPGSHVERYVRWGEREGFHTGSTCAARGRSRGWYDLTGPRTRGVVLAEGVAIQTRHPARMTRTSSAMANLFNLAPT